MEDFLLETLQSFLEADIDEDQFPAIGNHPSANDPKYKRLHGLQAYVGWSKLFNGHLVQEWRSQLEEAFLVNFPNHQQPDRKHYTGAIWTTLVSLL